MPHTRPSRAQYAAATSRPAGHTSVQACEAGLRVLAGATQRAPTVPGHRRCLGTVSETSPCSETVHPRTPSTLTLTSYRRCQGWKRCLRDGSWRSLARSDAEGRNTPARRSGVLKIVITPKDSVIISELFPGSAGHRDKVGRNALSREHQPLPANRQAQIKREIYSYVHLSSFNM